MTTYTAAILLLIIGSAADSITTWWALARSGNEDLYEWNPRMHELMERIGLLPMVLLRFAVGCILAAVVWAMDNWIITAMGAFFSILYCIVAFRNWGEAQ